MSDTFLLWLIMVPLTALVPLALVWKVSGFINWRRDVESRVRIYNLLFRLCWMFGAATILTGLLLKDETNRITAVIAGVFLLTLAGAFWVFRRPHVRQLQEQVNAESQLQ